MAEMAKWDEITFQITNNTALLFSDLQMKASCDTNDKELNKRKYTTFKIGKGVEISFNAFLNAAFGIDVRETIMQFLDKAQKGKSDHLTVGGKKLFPFLMRLTEAETEELAIAPNGTWKSATVKLTFKQGSKEWIYGEPEQEKKPSSGGGSGGGGKGPGKKYSTKSPPHPENGTLDAIGEISQKEKDVVSGITQDTNDAKTKPSPITPTTVNPSILYGGRGPR